MKIIVGISNAHKEEEIEAYAKAGVDEFFLGYVPKEWSDEYGFEISCNKREVAFCQYHTKNEIENVVTLIHNYGKKVFLTLNAHEYNNEQVKLLIKILKGISHIPFDGFIVGNVGLILELKNNGFDNTLHISIGGGCNNIEAIDFFTQNFDNIKRVILPRKLTMSEIEIISLYAKQKNILVEAFGMGAPCVFSDEYCFTWHGSVNKSFCQSPMYKHLEVKPLVFNESWKNEISDENVGEIYSRMFKLKKTIDQQRENSLSKRTIAQISEVEYKKLHVLTAITICGLCAFQKFKEWGVDTIKLPLREHSFTENLAIIELTRKVINEPNATPKFCKNLMDSPNFCSGNNCYYDFPYQS